jgi:hypothetical protein
MLYDVPDSGSMLIIYLSSVMEASGVDWFVQRNMMREGIQADSSHIDRSHKVHSREERMHPSQVQEGMLRF